MHLLELYATSTGSTVGKPFVYESFFPLPSEKYITFQAQTKFDSKDYSFWQDVINIIYPILTQLNIKIIQVGLANEKQYQYVVDFRGKTNINQLAYVIRNSSLHFGSDSFGVHLASGFDIPLVGLYSVIQASVAGPKFGTKSKQITLESFSRQGNKKPSYSPNESPKSINLIRPEEIANHILHLLGINFTIPFTTVFMGRQYGYEKIRDFIPNAPVGVTNPEVPIEIRMDLEFNEKVLAQQLSISKGIIITDRPINLQLLSQFKKMITLVIYEVKESDNPEFVVSVRNLGINISLISYLSQDILKNKKINYYELGKINVIEQESNEKIEELRKDIDNLYFRSNKIVFSNSKFYMSNASRTLGQEVKNDFEFQKVIDTPEFWHELNYMHIIKKYESPRQ